MRAVHQMLATAFVSDSVSQTPESTDFTIEWYQFMRGAGGGFPRPFSIGSWPTATLALETIGDGNSSYLWVLGEPYSWDHSNLLNGWHHVAITRSNQELSVWMDGELVRQLPMSLQQFNVTDALYVGGEGSVEGRFNGLIRDFHIVRGNALYTNTFTPGVLAPQPGTLLFVSGQDADNLFADSGYYGRSPMDVVGMPTHNANSPYGEGDPGSIDFSGSELVYDITVFDHVYAYYRLVTLETRSPSSNSVQLSELRLIAVDSFVSLEGTTVTNPGGSNPEGEEPVKAFDQNVFTKWLDFNKAPLVVQFPSDVLTTAWAYVTGNDATDRDPVRWTLEGSVDGINWTPLHYQRNTHALIPLNRITQTQSFVFPSF
jgi:hypothetical protein